MTGLSEDLPRSSSSLSPPLQSPSLSWHLSSALQTPGPPGERSEDTELREVVVPLDAREPRPSSAPCAPALPPSRRQHHPEIQTAVAAAALAAGLGPAPPLDSGAWNPRLLWLLRSQGLQVLLLGKEQSPGSGSRDAWSRSLVIRDPALQAPPRTLRQSCDLR